MAPPTSTSTSATGRAILGYAQSPRGDSGAREQDQTGGLLQDVLPDESGDSGVGEQLS